MQTSIRPQTLSSELLSVIRANLGEEAELSRDAGLQRRVDLCQAATTSIVEAARRQLESCGLLQVRDWLKHRALVIGYVQGLAEALLADAGIPSRWAVALASLNALMHLLGAEWDEDLMCAEAQRLWRQKNPSYLAGTRAAAADHEALGEGHRPTALAACVLEREMRDR